ncbi:MAG: hypothetical protein OEL76_17245 [Siculibacillus sp.]|nr:hypothetical protein [Siculibacillus sp.]
MSRQTAGTRERVHAFEMALTLDEMIRLAPHLDPAHPIEVEGRTVRGRFGATAAPWSMSIGEGRERAIGLIRFAIADVALSIAAADEATATAFLARFQLVFRKGGG